MNHSSKLALLGLSLALCACSTLESEKVDYKSGSVRKSPQLSVPPDLTKLSQDSRYKVPGGPVTASSYQAGGSTAAPSLVGADTSPDMKVMRSGSQRWLVVKRSPDDLWEPIKEFWLENGFLLAMDQSKLGIMETDWAENRAKLPNDWIRGTLGKLFDSIYSTGELDKYRTRLERTDDGNTEVFISHRGMIEVYSGLSSDMQKGQTMWQPRPIEPELEAEFLRRMMIKLGARAEQSAAAIDGALPKLSSRLTSTNGESILILTDNFDRAWRRVGLSLDRTGFTVEDRDRAQGLYFVRYVDPSIDRAEPGFFSKLFGNAAKPIAAQKFRIAVKASAESTRVSVMNSQGEAEASDNAQRILKVLADDLK